MLPTPATQLITLLGTLSHRDLHYLPTSPHLSRILLSPHAAATISSRVPTPLKTSRACCPSWLMANCESKAPTRGDEAGGDGVGSDATGRVLAGHSLGHGNHTWTSRERAKQANSSVCPKFCCKGQDVKEGAGGSGHGLSHDGHRSNLLLTAMVRSSAASFALWPLCCCCL